VDTIHDDQIREHGGLPGLRDENSLESALARARDRWNYGVKPDLATLAAAYGFALVKNHPYRDGNKRVGFVAMSTFLGINGKGFQASDAEVVATMVSVAAGSVSENRLGGWIRERLTRET
jgi:death-on-curing protein